MITVKNRIRLRGVLQIGAALVLQGLILLAVPSQLRAQEYGLGFAGQPNSKDRRTQLNLNPEDYFSLSREFELSFQIRIRDEWPMTFGYVCRIVDIHNNHVDLIFNGPKSNSFQVVYGNTLTGIEVAHPDSAIFKTWNEIRMIFDGKDQTIEFVTPDTSLTATGIHLSGKVKIFFGRNTCDPVQTTDVPTMDIKDIRIFKRDRCLHHFPLHELSGDTAKDALSGEIALVENPGWILPRYHDWKEHFSTRLHGVAPVCYAPHEENLYMVGDQQMKIFSVVKDSIQTIEYASVFAGLTAGSRVVYDALNKRLICYNLRDRTVFAFNFPESTWEKLSDSRDNRDRLWFHNTYYSAPDSLLYIFGGYSQHRYSSMVLQYDFNLHAWDTLATVGDVFHPRMHAAMGVRGDTVYIMGGFGSRAGDQVVNPRHYTDLMAFSLNDNRFEKKYDFIAPATDIDFAPSMVFESSGTSFYVLASSIYQYESYLQLLKGSLSGPELQSMGNKIPYLFHNENSYSDLFFSQSRQKLITVTSMADREKEETEFRVYTLEYPPYPTAGDESASKGLFTKNTRIVLILALALLTLFLVIRWIYKRAGRTAGETHGRGNGPAGHPDSEKTLFINGLNDKKTPNSFYFFGGFQVINRMGEDITKKFSPLVKELFLLIFLYSVKDKGISVSRITEVLWFPMDAKSAKNNRAVNIAKLKHLLSEIEGCELTRETEYWQIVFDDSRVYSDYYACKNLANQAPPLTRYDLDRLLHIVKAGSLLGNASYEWLDEFKLECSNEITDSLMAYLEKEKASAEPDLLVRIADAILTFDMMHEEAIGFKCRALTALGKHSLAREIFSKFSRDYRAMYDEPYDKNFADIIKNNS